MGRGDRQAPPTRPPRTRRPPTRRVSRCSRAY
nr:MAG TPA: hypothetical protein [Caudoviricetes sp.]